MFRNRIYYHLRPMIPRNLQILVRRKLISFKRVLHHDIWPIDEQAAIPPDGWPGWPDHKKFALVLTHDVETVAGQEKCQHLIQLEKELGFRSCFYFVPERYKVSRDLLYSTVNQGFEVGVHGLYHDGKLYQSLKTFKKRAIRINHYLKEWGAVGFRSPSSHHNLDWIHELNIKYDASTFDTDPFEPQSDGVAIIFPFWVQGNTGQRGYIELPYTLPQDHTLFILLKEKNSTVWQKKLDWIAEKGGMALLNVHPDYMNFNRKKLRVDEYPAEYYVQFLEHIKVKFKGLYWHVLPRDIARWASNLRNMKRGLLNKQHRKQTKIPVNRRYKLKGFSFAEGILSTEGLYSGFKKFG
ncbi:MAG: hypothetical protein ACFFCW_13425 [Candidatus Hodarchaeota archaeon]